MAGSIIAGEMLLINKKVLVSGADYFTDKDAINALMDSSISVDLEKAILEHQAIVEAFKKAGIEVIKVDPPKDCQDGIYTANWALVRNGKAVMSRLPNTRKPEEAYARKVLENIGLEIIELPTEIRAFSGQGDALSCDDTLFCQSPYRSSKSAHLLVKDILGFKNVLSLQTKPSRWFNFGPKKLNKITRWPDSPTYDIDLAVAILRPKTSTSPALIAYCPDVFKASSRKMLKELEGFEKIIVTKDEALKAFATNLVSTGETVILNSGAPKLKSELLKRDFKVIELALPELKKGGGSIRCSSLAIS